VNISKYEHPVDFSADEENSAAIIQSKIDIPPMNEARDLTILKLQNAGQIRCLDLVKIRISPHERPTATENS
jgi:hypothetical protein